MKKIILFIFIIVSLSAYSFTQKDIKILRNNERQLDSLYWKKVFPFLYNNPQFHKYLAIRGNALKKAQERQKSILGVKADSIPDTVRVLVLKAEFVEDTTSLTTGNGKMDTLGSSRVSPYIVTDDGDTIINPDYQEEYILEIDSLGNRKWVHNLYYDPPHDSLYFHNLMLSLRNYYLDDSHGRLYVDFDIYPKGKTKCYQLPHDMLYYGDITNFVGGLFNLLRDIVYEADDDPDVDFSQYDAIIIFHAGSMWQTDFGDSPYDIFAVYIGGAEYYFGAPIYTSDGTEVSDAVVYCETASQDNMIAFLQGGLAHEFGHALGLLDLYDTSWQRMGMGSWALMGTGNWNMSGLVPPHHSAYNAYVPYIISEFEDVFFNDPLTVHTDTSLYLYPMSFNDDTTLKMIKVPINKKEFFLVTNRFAYVSSDTVSTDPDSSGLRVWKDGVLVKINDYDMGLPMDLNTGGMAIYHIDESIIEADSGYNMINTEIPFAVDMEEGSGIQDFEIPLWEVQDWNATFYGEISDLYAKGLQNYSFGMNTMPNSKDNEGGNTFITIENLSSYTDTVAMCRIKFNYRQKGFPLGIDDILDVASPKLWIKNDTAYILIPAYSGKVYMFDINGNAIGSLYGNIIDIGLDANMYASPAIGDIDGDLKDEIVLTTINGDLMAYDTDSLVRNKFPLKEDFPISLEYPIVGSPVLADIDQDGIEEILINAGRHLYIMNADTLKKVYLGQDTWTTPVYANNIIFDVSGDGRLFAIDCNGNVLWTSTEASPTISTSSPAVGDINNDGKDEVIWFDGTGFIRIYDDQGNELLAKELSDTLFYSSPVLADIDGDGYLDIVALGKKLHVFDRNAVYLSGFPIKIDDYNMQSSPLIADVNNDGKRDIVFSVLKGPVYAYDMSGKLINGFPISGGQESFTTPLIYDMDNDGDIEIATFSSDGWVNVYDWTTRADVYIGSIHNNNSNNAYFVPTSLYDDYIVPNEYVYFYPNPFSNATRLRYFFESDGQITVSLFNVFGEKVWTGTHNINGQITDEWYMEISNISTGIYNAVIIYESINGEREKFIKKVGVVK